MPPYLFVIVVDYIIRQSVYTLHYKGIAIKPNKTLKDKNKYLSDLDYADDIALTATLVQNAQDLLLYLEDGFGKSGFSFSTPRRQNP